MLNVSLRDAKPMYYDILTEKDQRGYDELRLSVSSAENRYRRNKRLEVFRDMLAQIRSYCEQSDEGFASRCLVCGVCWIGERLAINTRQLKLLLAKSKSSINGALMKMGYGTAHGKELESAEVANLIPFLGGRAAELRQWTIRTMDVCPRNVAVSPKPVANYPTETAVCPNGYVSSFTKDDDDVKKDSFSDGYEFFTEFAFGDPDPMWDGIDDCQDWKEANMNLFEFTDSCGGEKSKYDASSGFCFHAM